LDREKRLRTGPIAKEGLIFIIPSFVLAAALFALQIFIAAFPVFLLLLFFLYFFRNPRRESPPDDDRLISPADGHVTEVREIDETEFLGERRIRIAIFMSPLDVHVNRAPCRGTVTSVNHRKGEFALAFKKEIDRENERNYIVISEGKRAVMMVQIAGFLARRIISYVRSGDTVAQGSVVGMIAFGSRVDLYLPKDFVPVVELKDKVKAGITVLAQRRGHHEKKKA
jgi:phosphatidylserine decarboxylase